MALRSTVSPRATLSTRDFAAAIDAELRATAGKMGSTAGDAEGDLSYLSISRLPIVGVAYADLFREVKVQEAIYEALLKQYEISKVEEAKATGSGANRVCTCQ